MRGSADFCEPYQDRKDPGKKLTTEETVIAYCHRYFRLHYDSSYEVFSQFFNPKHYKNTLFIDFGCGPGTSGIAFRDFVQDGDSTILVWKGLLKCGGGQMNFLDFAK